MSTSSANVRSLSTINKQIPEVKSLMDAASKISWDLRVPLISQTLGLGYSIDSKLLKKDMALPRGSIGRQIGFSTLGEVVSTPASDGGLDIPWEEWVSDIRAYNYKKTFGIYYQTQAEVIKEYSAVREALGHDPITLHEFSKTRDEIMIRNNHRRERQITEKVDEYKRFYEMELEKRESIEAKYSETSKDLQNLRTEYENLDSEYHSEIKVLKTTNDMQVKEAKEQAFAQASSDYRAKMVKLRREVKGLEGELSDALQKISSMEDSSGEMSELVVSLKKSIEEKNQELQMAEATIERQGEIIARHEQMIDELEQRIQEITTQTGVVQMEKTLEKYRERFTKLSVKYKTMSDSRKDLKAHLDKSRQRVLMLKAELRDKKLEIRAQNEDINLKDKNIRSHKATRNFLIVTTLSSLGLLTGLTYMML